MKDDLSDMQAIQVVIYLWASLNCFNYNGNWEWGNGRFAV